MAKLLLADDSITIQKVVELVLADEGFEIKTVNNGADALAVMSSFMPDIVLADIEMPKINGYQLCEKITQNPATAHIPVILLTTAFEPIDDELAGKVGSVASLVKPFESEDLINTVNFALTSRTGGVQEAAAVEESYESAEPFEYGIAVEAEPAGDQDLWGAVEVGESMDAVEAAEDVDALDLDAQEVSVAEAEEIGSTLSGISGVSEDFEATEIAPEETAFEDVSFASAPVAELPKPDLSAVGSQTRYAQPQPIAQPSYPSSAELSAIFKATANEKVAEFMKSANLKNEIIAIMSASLKDSVEKVLWEVTPNLVEKLANEAIRTSLESISKNVEKVIWETVPDLAESIIKKEIEKIKSEM